ncbi:MAG: cytochrome c [Paracoccus sp. (in: a-proteobacteria)]|nr:cytochrome c [Paracoccus sp. (in: a-proteobacteria)]
MRLFIAAILAAAPVIAPMGALAEDAIEDAIEAREGYMKMLNIDMGTLSGMARGDIPYDEAAARTAGNNIAALAGYDIAGLFIQGSAPDDGVETGALQAVWQNPDDFAAKYAQFQEAAAGAGDRVAGGAADIGPVLQALGGSCKACHDNYRKR